MPKRRYKNLKNLMYEQEITQQQLSKITGIPLSTLRRRFAGHEPWDFDYIEAVAPVLNIPFAKWLDYFYDREPPTCIQIGGSTHGN